MKPETFIRAANVGELDGPGRSRSPRTGRTSFGAGRRGWRAFEDRCPHHGALLGEGEIDGYSPCAAS